MPSAPELALLPVLEGRSALGNLTTSCVRTNELLKEAVANKVVRWYRVGGRARDGLAKELALADPSHRLFDLVHEVVQLTAEEQAAVVSSLLAIHDLVLMRPICLESDDGIAASRRA